MPPYISAVMANTNGLMLQAALGNPVSENVAKHTVNVVKLARRNMDAFMASPFNTPESRLAAEANAAFNEVYKVAEIKLGYLHNPAGYSGRWNTIWSCAPRCVIRSIGIPMPAPA
ncbi:hypothetical protein KIF59_06150 [Enterobacter cloacae subsp. cloacae]|nr:hypothetical protein [Enterobacter cloacae subsp. cloacae]